MSEGSEIIKNFPLIINVDRKHGKVHLIYPKRARKFISNSMVSIPELVF